MARVQVRGISTRIDGCERLLHKQSNQFHSHLPTEHKRWIDLEDVLQEGLIAAWQAETNYAEMWGSASSRDTKASKGHRPFSTYMAYGVRNWFSQTFRSPLSQQKRVCAGMAGLNDPVPGTDDMTVEDLLPPSGDPSPEMLQIGLDAFVAIGKRLAGASAAFFVVVMGCGVWPAEEIGDLRRVRAIVADIRKAVLSVACDGIAVEDMALVADSKIFRTKTLTLAREFTKMTMTGGHELKILQCTKCSGRYSLRDVEHGKFEPETLTCTDCYKRMQRSAPERSCFGKVKTETSEGFNDNDPECKLHCMDRKVCKQYVTGGRMTDTAILDDVDIEEGATGEIPDEDEAPAKKSTKKAAKKNPVQKAAAKAAKRVAEKKATTKAAKPAKAKAEANTKIVKTVDGKEKVIRLDDQGRDLPFKPNSAMRGTLVAALDGVKVSKLEADLKKAGWDVDFQMKMLRSGQSNGGKLLPYPVTHTWKLHEENGVIKASDVKRVATYSKLERVYASKSTAKTKKPVAKAKAAAKKVAKKK